MEVGGFEYLRSQVINGVKICHIMRFLFLPHVLSNLLKDEKLSF